jgi:hypothetical protein
MSKPLRLTAATLAIAALAPATASAAWTAPTTITSSNEANPTAQGAFGGSVLTGWLKPTVSLSKGLAPPVAITAADPFEKAWAAGLDRDGNAVVLTVRRHAPFQRIRATFVAADGTRSATRTISTDPHSSAQPQLSVASDGTAVAAWAWHDPAGWRAQVAVRRPGQAAFGKPQTVSPPAPVSVKLQTRPFGKVAAGDGGRPAVGPDRPLDGRQGHQLRRSGPGRVLGRRHRDGRLGQAGLALRGGRCARGLHPRGGRELRCRADRRAGRPGRRARRRPGSVGRPGVDARRRGEGHPLVDRGGHATGRGRPVLIDALRTAITKREPTPKRKHGNIPL